MAMLTLALIGAGGGGVPAVAETDESQRVWRFDGTTRGHNGLRSVPVPQSRPATLDDETTQGSLHVLPAEGHLRERLVRDFNVPPFPTAVEATLTRLDAEDDRSAVLLRAIDHVSGASVTVGSMRPGQISWASSDSGEWQDWNGFRDLAAPGGELYLQIARKQPGRFVVQANGRALETIDLPELRHIHRLELVVHPGSAGWRIESAKAYHNESTASDRPSERVVEVQPEKDWDARVAINPRANGYQIAFFERGFSDAMAKPDLREELLETVRELNVSSLRFPGGSWAYAYCSNSPRSIEALARSDIFIGRMYWLRHFHEYRWVDDRAFFEFCRDLDAKAIYQVNLGTWYDPEEDRAVLLAPFDAREDHTVEAEPDYMKDALAWVQSRVELADELGVPVIWEMGNEDYVYYTPQTYADQVHAFAAAIREVDPEARIVFCADGRSWSDWSWQRELFKEFAAREMTDLLDEAAVHIYFSGGGGGSRGTGLQMYEATQAAWEALKDLHAGTRRRLDEAGMSHVEISLTEYNTAFQDGFTGRPVEHSMGRALAEAWKWIPAVQNYYRMVFHDLVRNGYGHGTWFGRIYYMPNNPAGSRYAMPLPARVMSIMHEHANQHLLYSDGTVTVTQGESELLVTVGNSRAISRQDRIRISGTDMAGQALAYRGWAAADLSAPDAVEWEITTELDSSGLDSELVLVTPGFAFGHIRIPLD